MNLGKYYSFLTYILRGISNTYYGIDEIESNIPHDFIRSPQTNSYCIPRFRLKISYTCGNGNGNRMSFLVCLLLFFLQPNQLQEGWLALFTAKAVVTKGLKKWDRSSCD
jgi:hypothetical protein